MSSIKDQFLGDLLSSPTEVVASSWILERIPHIFSGDRLKYIQWKHRLSNQIKVDSAAIILIGSGCAGISLNPNKNFKPYNEDSDIDIAIVSDYHFNESWHFMRNMGSKIHQLPPKTKSAILEHVNKYIYWGTIATDKILATLPFGKSWITAIEDLKKIAPSNARTINFRIYKDFECLRMYHTTNLRKLKDEHLTGEDDDVKILEHHD